MLDTICSCYFTCCLKWVTTIYCNQALWEWQEDPGMGGEPGRGATVVYCLMSSWWGILCTRIFGRLLIFWIWMDYSIQFYRFFECFDWHVIIPVWCGDAGCGMAWHVRRGTSCWSTSSCDLGTIAGKGCISCLICRWALPSKLLKKKKPP